MMFPRGFDGKQKCKVTLLYKKEYMSQTVSSQACHLASRVHSTKPTSKKPRTTDDERGLLSTITITNSLEMRLLFMYVTLF